MKREKILLAVFLLVIGWKIFIQPVHKGMALSTPDYSVHKKATITLRFKKVIKSEYHAGVIGYHAANSINGEYNVFIGYKAGFRADTTNPSHQ